MTSTTSEVWKKQRKQPSQRDLHADLDDDEDDVPPEVPKRTSSKGPGSVAIQSASVTSTSASGRSSRESVSFRGHVRSVGNGAANEEAARNIHSVSTATPASTLQANSTLQKPTRVCLATGRPLVEWSSESTLGASELVRRHRLHHHHYHHHHHLAASYPRHGRHVGVRDGVTSRDGLPSHPRKSAMATRQVASADEASDSEEIDVCETCSEWLSKALLCSCQVPSSASSSPSQGQDQVLKQQQQVHREPVHPQQHQQQLRYQQQQRVLQQSRLVRP